VQAARLGITLFLFFLAGIGVFAGISLLTSGNEDLSDTGEVVVSVLWLVSALLYALAGVLLLRRPPNRGALALLGAALVAGGVLITVNPYFGAPLTAAAILVTVVGFVPRAEA
jgi:drug/metabolite transporter (DMT)-like permease